MRPPFSAWIEGRIYYLPLLIVGILVLVVLGPNRPGLYLGGSCIAAGLFALFFFRDPNRVIDAQPGELVSPADGRVVAIEDLTNTPYYEGPCRRVSIFLSVFNVHVNRSPFNGTVLRVEYKPGRFRNAMNPESSRVNESNAVWLETDQGPLTVRQISGAVARRIVCPLSSGDVLAKGEKFGMIKFGSRTELYMPPDTDVCVSLKDAVKGGSTIIARFAKNRD